MNPGSNITPVGPAYGTGRFNLAQTRYTGGDDVLWTHGAHSVRFGVSASRVQNNTWDPLLDNGVWDFNSFASFLAGQPARSVQVVVPAAGNSAYRDYRLTEISPYIQDDWKVTSKLTVNAGLRWEFVSNPTERLGRLYGITNFRHSHWIYANPERLQFESLLEKLRSASGPRVRPLCRSQDLDSRGLWPVPRPDYRAWRIRPGSLQPHPTS